MAALYLWLYGLYFVPVHDIYTLHFQYMYMTITSFEPDGFFLVIVRLSAMCLQSFIGHFR
jgi:hypothetical protein